MSDLHPAVRDVFPERDPRDPLNAEIQMAARSARLMDVSLKAYVRELEAGNVEGYAGAEDRLDRAEEYASEVARRVRALRELHPRRP